MEQRNWDQIGFRESSEQGGTVVGYFRRRDLRDLPEGLDQAPVRSFAVKELVAAGTPLRACLPRLIDWSRLFVLGATGVESVVTLADLQKQPVRIMLFGTISLLEMALSWKIKRRFPHHQWSGLLNEPRLRKAEKLHHQRHAAGHDTELADCLELCDKSDVLTHDVRGRADLGFESHKECKKFFNHLERLRDNLAHAQDPTEVAGWSEICAMLTRTEHVIRMLAHADE